jgi:hypothetical protein
MSPRISAIAVNAALIIEGTPHPSAASGQNMGVNHSRSYILMTQQFLHGANVVAILQKMGSKAMAEGMATDSFGNLGLVHCSLESFLDGAFVEMMAAGFS